MTRKIIISSCALFFISILFSILSTSVGRTQVPALGVSCPAGATALPYGQIINPITGKIQQLLCMDSNGNLTFPSTISGNIGFSGQLTAAAGNANGFVMTQGATFATGNSVIFNAASKFVPLPVVAFASLGTVQSAGNQQYCTDCTTAATCAGSGSGHMAVSNGTNWTCQ